MAETASAKASRLANELSVLQVVDAELRTSRGAVYQRRGKVYFLADRQTVTQQKTAQLAAKKEEIRMVEPSGSATGRQQ